MNPTPLSCSGRVFIRICVSEVIQPERKNPAEGATLDAINAVGNVTGSTLAV
jgi:hypothetical protein